VNLKSSHPGNVFEETEPVALYPEVSDPDGLNLSARLVIRAADGHVVEERPVPVRTIENLPPEPSVYRSLPVGAYDAELSVASDDGANLLRRHLSFVRLAAQVSPPADVGRGFGIVLEEMGSAVVTGQRELLLRLRPELVKVPVWWAARSPRLETRTPQSTATSR